VILILLSQKFNIMSFSDRGTGMDGGSSEGSDARFAAYVEALGAVLGHADRQEPMRDDCLGC
jgi:hypothetical protein